MNSKISYKLSGKINIYQVFTRLFGNKNTTNKKWGTITENGVGKFSDFTNKALSEIYDLGITHIWFTGVLHHAMVTDYSRYGISGDNSNIVKGLAGSPYAIKDYYNVNPDLADNPRKRLEEFEELIIRAHNFGLKVILDIVPNHVARSYKSISKPEGIIDFGENDNAKVEYSKNNDFYYIPDEKFIVPDGIPEPLKSEILYNEFPAKWTGDGARKSKPKISDWYETIKINYGVKPDGSYDFDKLPDEYINKDYISHFNFWVNKDIPKSWSKFREITHFWLKKGVDGFRYDMAEMVPVEFWSYLNSFIKTKSPDSILVAEVYKPELYRDFIYKAKMDYLYDKVDFYDSLKLIMQGKNKTIDLIQIQNKFNDIEHNLLHFLENHDEQRIASKDFAGKAEKGKPAMVVSTCISSSPTMLYFAQELGEPGDSDAGYGSETRTTIFDYYGVPSQQRWMNNGQFDGNKLSKAQKELRCFYKKLLNFARESSALKGKYQEIHTHNLANSDNYSDDLISFIRWSATEKIIVVSNFNESNSFNCELKLNSSICKFLSLSDGIYKTIDILSDNSYQLKVCKKIGFVLLGIKPLQSYILKF